MNSEFVLEDGILLQYRGSNADVVIPNNTKIIGKEAFVNCKSITSVAIPHSVTKIESMAFAGCEHLDTITIPYSVVEIGDGAFANCRSLSSAQISNKISEINWCVFSDCVSLTSITIPGSAKRIGMNAFAYCEQLKSVTILDGVTTIEMGAFLECPNLKTVSIPNSVEEINKDAFLESNNMTIICPENSFCHRHCEDSGLFYIFDYQANLFRDTQLSDLRKLTAPFGADEKKPYIFISYSHKNSEEVFEIITELYEKGWHIWYDEGLSIGDLYDKTIEDHIKNSSVFLLFVTKESEKSNYILKNELQWAIKYKKPIFKCYLDKNADINFEYENLKIVTQNSIETELARENDIDKGSNRIVQKVSVIVNPTVRDLDDSNNGFTYCLYSKTGSDYSRSILYKAKNYGCRIYNAITEGMDAIKLEHSSCLTVFVDNGFLEDITLKKILAEQIEKGKDIAVWLLENISLPKELSKLGKIHWLNCLNYTETELITRYSNYLNKKGCRNLETIPNFTYEETNGGMVLTKFTGKESIVDIPLQYGGVPVIEIQEETFKGNQAIKEIIIPDCVTRIGRGAFSECANLSSVSIPQSITEIEESTFFYCVNLSSVNIPYSITKIGKCAFCGCEQLKSVVIPEGVKEIEENTFSGCKNLTSITLPYGITRIGVQAFEYCKSLTSIILPDSVIQIDDGAFEECENLNSIIIPDSVVQIDDMAFEKCENLNSIVIPDSVNKIGEFAFSGCRHLTVVCSKDSYAWNYCKNNIIPVIALE